MIETIIYNRQKFIFEIPDNYHELLILKMRLEAQYSLLQKTCGEIPNNNQIHRFQER